MAGDEEVQTAGSCGRRGGGGWRHRVGGHRPGALGADREALSLNWALAPHPGPPRAGAGIPSEVSAGPGPNLLHRSRPQLALGHERGLSPGCCWARAGRQMKLGATNTPGLTDGPHLCRDRPLLAAPENGLDSATCQPARMQAQDASCRRPGAAAACKACEAGGALVAPSCSPRSKLARLHTR